MPPTATTTAPCEAHKGHSPEPTYCELHHVIPQAWQRYWRPPGPTGSNSARRAELVMAGDAEAATLVGIAGLWDPRTATLCRTGHGNVHFWLVRAMGVYASTEHLNGSVEEQIQQVWKAVVHGVRAVRSEVAIARLGMERWVAAGGSLKALTDAGLRGEI